MLTFKLIIFISSRSVLFTLQFVWNQAELMGEFSWFYLKKSFILKIIFLKFLFSRPRNDKQILPKRCDRLSKNGRRWRDSVQYNNRSWLKSSGSNCLYMVQWLKKMFFSCCVHMNRTQFFCYVKITTWCRQMEENHPIW